MYLRYKDIDRSKVNSWKKINHSDSKFKKSGVAIIVSDNKIYFKPNTITSNKEGHFIINQRYNNWKCAYT